MARPEVVPNVLFGAAMTYILVFVIMIGIELHKNTEEQPSIGVKIATKNHSETLEQCGKMLVKKGNKSTATFSQSTARKIEQFYPNILGWNSERISFYNIEDFILQTNLTIEDESQRISFSNISLRVPLEGNYDSGIICDFNENLKLTIPANGSIRLDGEIYVVHKPHSNQTSRYKISLENVELIYIRRNDNSSTEIVYKNFHFQIDFSEESNHKSLVDATNQLLDNITPLMKYKINEKFTRFADNSLPFRNILSVCMNTPSESPEDDYIVINGNFMEAFESLNVRLKISSVILSGLSHMKSIHFHPDLDNQFKLLYNNIQGYCNWTYTRIGYQGSWHNLKFQIDDLTVTGITDSNQISHLFYDFTPQVTCPKSNHSLSSFAEVIVAEKITQILATTFSYSRGQPSG